MQLIKVFFDAYKSLLGRELELADNCIGLVGKNEAGKSNVLSAIGKLSRDSHLTLADTPKMAKKQDPALRFRFVLDENERKQVLSAFGELAETLEASARVVPQECQVTYHVRYDKGRQEEGRRFTIEGIQLPAATLVRKAGVPTQGYLVKRDGGFFSLDETILLTKDELKINEELQEASVRLAELRRNAESARNESAAVSDEAEPSPLTERESPADPPATAFDAEIVELAERVGEFDITHIIEKLTQEALDCDAQCTTVQALIGVTELRTQELQAVEKPDEAQTRELAAAKKQITSARSKLDRLRKSKATAERQLEALRQPFADKFTDDPSEVSRHLDISVLDDWLPKVVFWKNTPDYILSGETDFAEIRGKDLSLISRPLVNLFRIGLNITTKEELESIVQEIQGVDGERSRYEQQMNKSVSEYLKEVWPEYDQDIKIALERERIRVEFFDPKRSGASFYTMDERSQGCKTFISFLLTIGAEAKRGVIRDTVLLLDEPETHLHPSGVRFMLQELIRAAANGNKVIFATHSVFMIDQDRYDRHVILRKEAEHTTIQPSRRDRIGFFMQEEVLYGALDVNLGKAFATAQTHNFVFEGDGDVTVFECFYAALLDKDVPFAAEATRFYHGGKCTDIRKYLINRPIQVLSKWIFILDKDRAGDDLREFIEGKYKDYIGQCVHVFQYDYGDSGALEFEDLLPEPILKAVVLEMSHDNDGQRAAVEQTLGKGRRFLDSLDALSEKDAHPPSFLPRFKETLNGRLRDTTATLSASQQFKSQFPKYHDWAAAIVGRLRKPGRDFEEGTPRVKP